MYLLIGTFTNKRKVAKIIFHHAEIYNLSIATQNQVANDAK
jgi:hypothetical protein